MRCRFSSENQNRESSYAANALREEVKVRTRNLDDYLSSFEMHIQHTRFDKINRPRIAQLVDKTNQFNLTTKRYTEADVVTLVGTPDTRAWFTRVGDRFGDFGIVGIVIAKKSSVKAWYADSWLLSCRVLGCFAAAREADSETITACYVATPKNGMLAQHFDSLGFERRREEVDGTARCRLSIISCPQAGRIDAIS